MSTLSYESLCRDMERIKRELATPTEAPTYPNVSAPTIIGEMPSFGGMRIIESPIVEPVHVADEIDTIPISRNRSRRVFKKLCKRRQANAKPKKVEMAYVFNGNLIASPRVNDALKQAFQIRMSGF